MEKVGCVRREETIMNHVDGLLELRIGFIILTRLVAVVRGEGNKCISVEEGKMEEARERERGREKIASSFYASQHPYSPLPLQLSHFIHSHSKDEDVVSSHLLSHLNIGSIKSTNSQGTIRLRKITQGRVIAMLCT